MIGCSWAQECQKHNVSNIVRACEPTYGIAPLTKAGISVHVRGVVACSLRGLIIIGICVFPSLLAHATCSRYHAGDALPRWRPSARCCGGPVAGTVPEGVLQG